MIYLQYDVLKGSRIQMSDGIVPFSYYERRWFTRVYKPTMQATWVKTAGLTHVARIVGLQTDAVVVTETGFILYC